MGLPWNVALKFDWAAKHVHTLQIAHDKFIATEPYVYRRTIQGGTLEGEGTDHVFLWERYTEPPDCLGLIAGDAIHNARSALDHLALALAQHGAASKGVTMTKKAEARIQFPVVSSDADFEEQVRRGRLKFVDPKARALIKARQPHWVSPADPDSAHLMRIADFDNADKHRILTPVAHAMTIRQLNWPNALRDTEAQFPPVAIGSRYGEPGTEIFRFTFTTPQREVDVPCEIGFGCILFGVLPMMEIWASVGWWIDTVRIVASEIADRFLP